MSVFSHVKPSPERGLSGAWLLVVVGTQALSVLTGLLVPRLSPTPEWAVFAALLVGRLTQGWRGRRATRWLYVGAGLLLLAYVGSRFVLEVVLGRATP